jgi:hypothetical protein
MNHSSTQAMPQAESLILYAAFTPPVNIPALPPIITSNASIAGISRQPFIPPIPPGCHKDYWLLD